MNNICLRVYVKQNKSRILCAHQDNCGVARARLNGVNIATGEWIGFVDGDDVIEPDMYERLLENALNYHADISHCGCQIIAGGGDRIHYFYNTGRLLCQDWSTGIKDLLEGRFIEPGLWNKLFHISLFQCTHQKLDIIDGIRDNEDLLMNYHLFNAAKKAIYEDFCPYHYMAVSTSATRSAFKLYKALDPIKVNKIILDDIDESLAIYARRRYLTSCINGYAELYNRSEYSNEAGYIKELLLLNKRHWDLLEKRTRLRLFLMMNMPGLYQKVYKTYEKYLQKKEYE